MEKNDVAPSERKILNLECQVILGEEFHTKTNMNQISTGRVGHQKLPKVLLGFQSFLYVSKRIYTLTIYYICKCETPVTMAIPSHPVVVVGGTSIIAYVCGRPYHGAARNVDVFTNVFTNTHNLYGKIFPMIFSWQPLGPLLKVKLLVGYM